MPTVIGVARLGIALTSAIALATVITVVDVVIVIKTAAAPMIFASRVRTARFTWDTLNSITVFVLLSSTTDNFGH